MVKFFDTNSSFMKRKGNQKQKLSNTLSKFLSPQRRYGAPKKTRQFSN